MKSKSFLAHILVAALLSYGLSIFFRFAFGVFNLGGFIGVSALAAAIGLLAGWLSGKRLLVTALVTVMVRIGLYYFMTRG